MDTLHQPAPDSPTEWCARASAALLAQRPCRECSRLGYRSVLALQAGIGAINGLILGAWADAIVHYFDRPNHLVAVGAFFDHPVTAADFPGFAAEVIGTFALIRRSEP